jgi:hypothetical protein
LVATARKATMWPITQTAYTSMRNIATDHVLQQ